jgi:phenylalanyl-tRNA synthetase beta chain
LLCSAKELGLSEDASGCSHCPNRCNRVPTVREALALDDALVTLKILPNRPRLPLGSRHRPGSLRDHRRATAAAAAARASRKVHARAPRIRIEDLDACPRFAARLIEGIDPKAPTPDWMMERIERSGIPVPLRGRRHHQLRDAGAGPAAPRVRPASSRGQHRRALRARGWRDLVLLNGETLELQPDLLLVADEKKPLGLAGIMGGEHSGIANDTTTVLLWRGAFWNPTVIQGRMRRLGFISDAGYRFERGVDPELGPVGVDRAAQLIVDICGGRAGPLADVKGSLPVRRARHAAHGARAKAARSRAVTGNSRERLPAPATAASARGSGFRRHAAVVPLRSDARGGLVEEVARIHGFDRIPAEPSAHVQHMLPAPETQSSADHAQAAPSRPRMAGSDHLQLRVERRVERRSIPKENPSRC